MFNSYGLLDVILAGDGKDSRVFRTSGEVKCALKQAGVPIAEVEEEIDGLDCGVTCEMPVSGSQKDRFYSLAEENEFTEPIQ